MNEFTDIENKDSLEDVTQDPTVVLWTAKWVPVLGKIKTDLEKLSGSRNFYVIDVDANSSLADRYGIVALPTFCLYVSGKEKMRMTGAVSLDEIEKFVRKADRR